MEVMREMLTGGCSLTWSGSRRGPAAGHRLGWVLWGRYRGSCRGVGRYSSQVGGSGTGDVDSREVPGRCQSSPHGIWGCYEGFWGSCFLFLPQFDCLTESVVLNSWSILRFINWLIDWLIALFIYSFMGWWVDPFTVWNKSIAECEKDAKETKSMNKFRYREKIEWNAA